MENIFLRWSGCGAFEVRLGDVNFAFDPFLLGEKLEKAEPIYDYIFISHEHFDHCQPKSLRQPCRGDRFKKLFIIPGCLKPAGPASFDRDLPITKHIAEEKLQVIYPKYLNNSKGDERTFPGPVEADLGNLRVETIESDENESPQLPTCGYLVAHKEKESRSCTPETCTCRIRCCRRSREGWTFSST